MASVKPDDLMTTESKGTTAADAIAQVRNALNELVGPEGLGIVPPLSANPTAEQSSMASKSVTPQGSNSTFKEADLHALSRVPISTSRRKLGAALEALRGAASARESWEPSKAERLLRVKQDMIAKQRMIRASKSAVAECRRFAITEDPFATPVALAVQRLRAVADATGATTAEDTVENVATEADKGSVQRRDRNLTVCGTKFLADFHFVDVSAQEINVKVKFRRLTADDSEVGDDDVDESFAELIQNEDFTSLKHAFEKLIAEERLSADVAQEISLIDAMRCFEDDLLEAQRFDKKDELSDEDSIRAGHGIIKRTALGLNVVFMKDHSAYLGVEDATPPRDITVERTHRAARQDLIPEQVAGAENPNFTDGKMASVGAQYVLQFTKPIIVCLSVAQRLERVGRGGLGSANDKATLYSSRTSSRDFFSSRGEPRAEDGVGENQHWPSLQKLLAPTVFAGQDRSEADGGSTEAKGEPVHTAAKEVVKRLDHWSQDSTEFVAAAALPEDMYIEFSHSGRDAVAALAVYRVPLCHPRNVKPIFRLLRQQVVFNHLFQSCFATPIYPDSSKTALQAQPVEVVLCDTPSFILLNFYDKSLDDILSMGVSVELGGDINVKLKTSSSQHHVCTDEKASEILRVSNSIPLSIMTIIKLGETAASHAAQ